jgi:signal peptidase II
MKRSIVVLVSLFLLDRLIKNIIWFSPRLQTEGFLHPVLNTNIAFSFHIPGISSMMLMGLLIGIVIGFFIFVIRLFQRNDPQVLWWALVAIGALSNVLDRMMLGGVLDYIDLGWFPIFNLSDSYITVGVAALLYYELFRKLAVTRKAS